MTLLRQSLASPRATRFHRRHRAFAGGAAGRACKTIFIPRLTALENRTLLATLVVDPTGSGGAFTTIQLAVNAANVAGGDTIEIHPATYTEQVTIDKSLTMMGTAPGVIIQAPPTLTPDLGLNSVVEIKNAAIVTVSDLTIQGPVPDGITIDAGILVVGGATANVTNSTIAHIRDETLNNISGTGYGILVGDVSGGVQVGTATITNDTITDYQKEGIRVNGGSSATITDNMIATEGPATSIAQNGIVINTGATATITDNTITGNQYTGPGSGPDPITTTQAAGIILLGSASVTGNTVTGNDIDIASSTTGATISGNKVENSFEGVYLLAGTATVSGNTIDGNNIGVALIAFVGDTANAEGTLVSNNIFNNGNGMLTFPGAGISVLAESGATTMALVTANFNRIVGNSVGVDNTTTSPAEAPLNWWGSNTGPNTTGNDTTTGTVNTSPWLVLSLSASPATIVAGATAVVTADLTKDSGGATHSTAPFFPDQIPIAFSATGGTIAPASVPTISGMASSDFTSSTPGTASASVTLDNQTLSTPITIQSTPTVTGLSPTSGPAAGGTSVTITGTGFTGATAVNFGTTAAKSFTVVNDTTINAVSPAGTGAVNVTVVTPNGTSPGSAAAQFTFAAAAPTVVTLVRFGFHAQQTSLVLTFSAALNPTPAQDVKNYQIATADGTVIPVTSAVYDPTALTVTLIPAQHLTLTAMYQLTVNGTTPGGLTSATGVPLDGAGNGTPGTNFVRMFSGGILAGPATALQSAQPKRFAALQRQLAADMKRFAAERSKLTAAQRFAQAKRVAALEKRLATNTRLKKEFAAQAVDHVLGSGNVSVKRIAARRHGRHN